MTRRGAKVGRNRERLLGGLLGDIHVTKTTDQAREGARSLTPEHVLDQHAISAGISNKRRTSTAPPESAARPPAPRPHWTP